jgi:hypothetical protein
LASSMPMWSTWDPSLLITTLIGLNSCGCNSMSWTQKPQQEFGHIPPLIDYNFHLWPMKMLLDLLIQQTWWEVAILSLPLP